jgi:hypothetical protein
MVSLTHAKKRRTARLRGRLVNHFFDWMAHEANLAKGVKTGRAVAALWHSNPGTHQHDVLPLCPPRYPSNAQKRHRTSPTLSPVHDTPASSAMGICSHELCRGASARGLWEGWRHMKWPMDPPEILLEHTDSQIPPAEYASALEWLKQLTLLLQNALLRPTTHL